MGSFFRYFSESAPSKRQCGEHGPFLLPFSFLDLGCNQGDLTIAIAQAIHENLNRPIVFAGIDIDSELIGLAVNKWKDSDTIKGRFLAGNICTQLDLLVPDMSVDLVSLLSTTMWVHVHVGDEGLKSLLETVCLKSRRFVILEPQPSKCYRNAVIRLRRMGLPELNVSNDVLQWRPKIEDAIEETLNRCSFYRVIESKERTAWNRSIYLYERRI
jgi:SAM-dependent methyltransferase